MATPLGEPGTDVDALIASYFARSLHTVISEAPGAFETEELPLARIKRIMKQDSCDPFPRMISADAVPFMAFAVKLLIGVLTTLAWKTSTQRSKTSTPDRSTCSPSLLNTMLTRMIRPSCLGTQ